MDREAAPRLRIRSSLQPPKTSHQMATLWSLSASPMLPRPKSTTAGGGGSIGGGSSLRIVSRSPLVSYPQRSYVMSSNNRRTRSLVVCMAPEYAERWVASRFPFDPIEWEPILPPELPEGIPQFSPIKIPLPPPIPQDVPFEEEEFEEEEDEEKEEED